MKLAIALALLGATSVSAAPYYLGENIQPQNNITLGFADTPTKKTTATKSGNIMALELKGNYALSNEFSLRAGLPFYSANKNATGTGDSRNSIGNIYIGGVFSNSIASADQVWTYGYALSADVYGPTSRKDEAAVVAAANPTTDLWKYYARALAMTPTIGGWIARDMFTVKANFGANYAYVGQKSGAPTDQNKLALTGQLAGSWHAMNNLNLNVEYNTIYGEDSLLKTAVGDKQFRHGITPSISGNYDQLLASAFATIPLDSTTRDLTNVAFGANVGYLF